MRTISLSLWLCLLTAFAPALSADAPPPPNVLLIVADDLGAVDLTCDGADLHETPHLDRLAAQGMRFTSAYAAASICTPTRAALLTGKHPARLGMTIWREAADRVTNDRVLTPPQVRADLPLSEVTLAEQLQAAGYLTAHVGKWHLGEASHFPETQGYDLHVGGNHFGAPATHLFPFRGQSGTDFRYVPGLLRDAKPGDYLADRLTAAAIDIVERAADRPWLLTLWHYSVHTPIEAPAEAIEHFQSRVRPEHHHKNPVYAAMIKNLDDNIGRLLHRLDELGCAERTLVIFTSDNGGYLGPSRQQPDLPVTSNHPLRSGKGALYEGGIRVPLLIRWPGHVPAGSECAAAVTSCDFYQSILAAAHVQPRLDAGQQADGFDIEPLWRDPTKSLAREELFWHYPHYYPTTTPASAIRSGEWKLIEYFEDGRCELYNLRDDPSEATDLAAAEPARAKQLQERLAAWRVAVDAPLPTRADKVSEPSSK